MDADTADPLRVERAGAGYAIVSLDRPQARNALSRALRARFAAIVGELDADPAVRVLILSATGPIFTAGLDLAEWDDAGAPAAGAFESGPVDAITAFRGPVIGAINGHAITGGFEIAMACDLLVVAETASFVDTHAQVGLLPGWGLSPRLVRRVGLARAKELAFTSRPLSARQALEWGLVNRVVAPDRLLPEAIALAAEMLAADPATLVAYRDLLDEVAGLPLARALEAERARALAWNREVTREQVLARLASLRARRAARHADR